MSPHTHATSAVGSAPRRGMTLVELLVVAAVVSMLLGLVVTGVRGGRQVQKRGAETLAAVLAAAQARALGVPEGAAAILASGTGAEPNAAAACTQVYDAVMQPLIEATVTGTLPMATVTPTNGDDMQRAYKILLYGDSPVAMPPTAWLAFTPPSTVAFRGAVGQTSDNTVWPRPPVSGTFSALLAQYPAESSTVAELGEGSAIDLRFSGIGDSRSTTYGRLDDKGAVAVVFDRVGRVAEVIQQVPDPGQAASPGAAQPAIPVGTIYFLVVPREQIVSSAASNPLASQDAAWVALSPQTGRVFVADNVPQSDTSDAALRAARAKARQGIGVGK
jgi:prepilin-type N-terminal cleavage/methylation domain-containing protein